VSDERRDVRLAYPDGPKRTKPILRA